MSINNINDNGDRDDVGNEYDNKNKKGDEEKSNKNGDSNSNYK